MTKPASARQLLEQVSTDLGLSVEFQDWGIVNADGERLEEFAEYLVTRPLLPTQ